ncbi:class I SAM-dependent methyltransferase [Haloarchaeobius sp. TZWWS8]|uniref:class I SAM-dependent methyltransferase n=1 Tax=Haloarchaeobius sp. TZWWS8 TaxID=3446121 RepID=UPI003EBC6B87
MPTAEDAERFASTEDYYASYRPGYCDEAFDLLAERFELDDDARVLDLGCGAGQLTLPMARRAGDVVAMDPNDEMLANAKERIDGEALSNVEFVLGSDADLPAHTEDLEPLRLTTMGRSFHWMDQERTLEILYELTEPDGGVAIMTDQEWLTKGTEPWQSAVYEVVDAYLDDLPERVDPAEVEYEVSWTDLLAEYGFTDVREDVFRVEREWDAGSIVGYVFSLSFCSPRRFGDRKETFEADLRARLDELGGPFTETARVEVLSGVKPAN